MKTKLEVREYLPGQFGIVGPAGKWFIQLFATEDQARKTAAKLEAIEHDRRLFTRQPHAVIHTTH